MLKANKYGLAAQMLSNKGFTQLNSMDSTLITQISQREVGEDFSSALKAQRWLRNVKASTPRRGEVTGYKYPSFEN